MFKPTQHLIFMGVIFFHLGASYVQASFITERRSIGFQDAWEEGRFNGKSLRNVVELYPDYDNQLNEDQKEHLANSKSLTNLRFLNISYQDIDDNFIATLSGNSTFSRLMTLDLSDNPSVTNQSLDYILRSNYLGSIQDSPSISGRYGIPASEISISVKGTSITQDAITRYTASPRFDFSIRYLNPRDGQPTASRVIDSIKSLQVQS